MNNKKVTALLCSTVLYLAPAIGAAQVCTQGNALTVQITGSNAVAYLPNGAWDVGATGIRVVTLEGSGSPTSIATAGVVDSCASNPTTQQTVCTATDSDVYLISGTTLTNTLQSNGTGTVYFSGGPCGNCAVAINTSDNVAYIEEAYSDSEVSNVPALQSLDLSTNKFGKPLQLINGLSESILVDPVRNVLLSATEDSSYDIIKLNGRNNPSKEYGNFSESAEYDSSGEDCTTGFIIGSDEFTSNLFLADISSVKFHNGTMIWSDNKQSLDNFPEFELLSAGTTGISVAPGTHYAVLSGEFGGDVTGFLQLPDSVSFKKAALKDFVAAYMPNDPNGYVFQNGYDPHSVTSYTSPNNGRAYAVLADWADGSPDYLAVVDIAALMAAPRVVDLGTGKHLVKPSYNLISHGIVRYVRSY